MSDNLQQLTEAGVSIWLDDLSRERIETGNLAELAKNDHVVGVTTNPSIFAAALSEGERYDDQVRELAAQGKDVDEVVFALTTTDVRNACDVIREVYDATNGVDGRVSIEVDPRMAHDTDATNAVRQGALGRGRPAEPVHQDPGHDRGRPGDHDRPSAEGISVNVTLIFGLDRYQSRHGGLRVRPRAGARQRQGPLADPLRRLVLRLPRRHRDRQAARRNSAAPDDLKGKAGVANARLAYKAYEEFFSGDRWESLAADGANRQRPLWASTGVKNPDYKDTMYVDDLVVREHREHDAGEDPRRGPRPQRDPGRPGAAALRRRPAGDGGPEGQRASTTTT